MRDILVYLFLPSQSFNLALILAVGTTERNVHIWTRSEDKVRSVRSLLYTDSMSFEIVYLLGYSFWTRGLGQEPSFSTLAFRTRASSSRLWLTRWKHSPLEHRTSCEAEERTPRI